MSADNTQSELTGSPMGEKSNLSTMESKIVDLKVPATDTASPSSSVIICKTTGTQHLERSVSDSQVTVDPKDHHLVVQALLSEESIKKDDNPDNLESSKITNSNEDASGIGSVEKLNEPTNMCVYKSDCSTISTDNPNILGTTLIEGVIDNQIKQNEKQEKSSKDETVLTLIKADVVKVAVDLDDIDLEIGEDLETADLPPSEEELYLNSDDETPNDNVTVAIEPRLSPKHTSILNTAAEINITSASTYKETNIDDVSDSEIDCTLKWDNGDDEGNILQPNINDPSKDLVTIPDATKDITEMQSLVADIRKETKSETVRPTLILAKGQEQLDDTIIQKINNEASHQTEINQNDQKDYKELSKNKMNTEILNDPSEDCPKENLKDSIIECSGTVSEKLDINVSDDCRSAMDIDVTEVNKSDIEVSSVCSPHANIKNHTEGIGADLQESENEVNITAKQDISAAKVVDSIKLASSAVSSVCKQIININESNEQPKTEQEANNPNKKLEYVCLSEAVSNKNVSNIMDVNNFQENEKPMNATDNTNISTEETSANAVLDTMRPASNKHVLEQNRSNENQNMTQCDSNNDMMQIVNESNSEINNIRLSEVASNKNDLTIRDVDNSQKNETPVVTTTVTLNEETDVYKMPENVIPVSSPITKSILEQDKSNDIVYAKTTKNLPNEESVKGMEITGDSLESTILSTAPIVNFVSDDSDTAKISSIKMEDIESNTETQLKTLQASNVEITKFVQVEHEDLSQNDSIGIMTDHCVNKPDVMLHIPSQEMFDFGKEFGETDIIDKTIDIIDAVNSPTEDSDNKLNPENTKVDIPKLRNQYLTVKTVSQIVKQLEDNEKLNALEKEATPIEQNETQQIPNTPVVINMTQNLSEEKPNIAKSDKTIEKNTETQQMKDQDEPQQEKEMIVKENQPLEIHTQPSTSKSEVTKMVSDDTEAIQETTDSLGLLAESSRSLLDDDEIDDDADEVDDDDDEFPDDESSNQITAENSEDSNEPSDSDAKVDIAVESATNNELDSIQDSEDNKGEDLQNALESTLKNFDNNTESSEVMGVIGDVQTIEALKVEDKVNEGDEIPNEEAMDVIDETVCEEEEIKKKDEIETETAVAALLADQRDQIEEVQPSSPKSKEDDATNEDTGKDDEHHENDKILRGLLKENLPRINLKIPTNDVVNLEDSSEDETQKDKEKEICPTTDVTTAKKTKKDADKSIKDKESMAKRPSQDTESAQCNAGDAKEEDKIEDEIFSLDSDSDEDSSEVKLVFKRHPNNKCINNCCESDDKVDYHCAERAEASFYHATEMKKALICHRCREYFDQRAEELIDGIKDLRPLMELEMGLPSQQLVEIIDSDSEEEIDFPNSEIIGEKQAKFIEGELADLINDTWNKYDMDDRLKETETYLMQELDKMEEQTKEITDILNECQKATDLVREEFYGTFRRKKKELLSLIIHDTPVASYTCNEIDIKFTEVIQDRYPKRRSTITIDIPAKKQALTSTQAETEVQPEAIKEDDKDVSVVKLSSERAPADLPPPGEVVPPEMFVGMAVYAMKHAFGPWMRGVILEILPKPQTAQFTKCRVQFEHKAKNPWKTLMGRCIASIEPSTVRMTIGTRVIALFKNTEDPSRKESYYSGVIAEIPNPVNNYRYLIFFDDGYAQYVHHRDTRLVCECSTLVWEEVHPFSRDFVCNYLLKYPERPMVRMHQGQNISVERNGKWWDTTVVSVDASLVLVQFVAESRREWLYRGSTRLRPLFMELQAAGRARARLPRSKAATQSNMPYVEYTRTDDTKPEAASAQELTDTRYQRSVAKKSTAFTSQPISSANSSNTAGPSEVVSRIVYYSPKNSVRPHKMVAHTCGPKCKRSDVIPLSDLRTYNPLAKPMLSGWDRQIIRYKCHRIVMYRAPCGRRLRDMAEIHHYLQITNSDMGVDLFDLNVNTHCLAEFVLNKCIVGKKDLSHGKENIPVPCVNYVDESLPEFCSYNTERTPTAGVPLNLNPDFLCGCDCTDDCADKSKCACWQMTLEGARTIGLDEDNVGYHYRRLPEPLPTGIYECNSRCKCKKTCLNRVAQHPLQLKLQVFKTVNRGWGIRALNDVPKGAFLCVYAGNLLTDATANLDGLNEGDEYLAELDYIEVVEGMKEGYEEDVPEADKKLDSVNKCKEESDDEDETESEEEVENVKEEEDDDFEPGYIRAGVTTFSKRLRRRDKKANEEEAKITPKEEEAQVKEEDEDFITISDDEEVREPARFAAQQNMGAIKAVSKYKSIRSYFGKDEACYIMDAKVQGNIGRYLNHSCSPNVFVQNVFVDTHDPRFPWVAFFALHHIKTGTELTWNYNYDVGSVPGKVLYCFCGANNCRGRLL